MVITTRMFTVTPTITFSFSLISSPGSVQSHDYYAWWYTQLNIIILSCLQNLYWWVRFNMKHIANAHGESFWFLVHFFN